MELGLGSTLLPGDPRLIDHIVAEVKSQGIFDQFRKECIADVDTKPAYQNLNARVESSVNSFLNKQTWRADLNKNQLRETLRKHIHDAPYLEVGVDRIVDQVVNPKVYSVFMPKIEDVVYKYLGIERPKPQRNGACDLKDLLPTDLDPVSPESDRDSIKDENMEIVEEDEKKIVNGDEEKPSISNIESKPLEESASPVKKENTEIEIEKETPAMDVTASPVKAVLNTSFKSDEGVKTEEEEEESPDFEPIDMHLNESNMSNDSHLSGISELTSHRSASPDFATDFARDNFDCSNQDSQLSKVSSNSRLSIVTDVGSSNHGSTPKSDAKEDSKSAKDGFKAVKEFDSNKDSKFSFDVAKIKDNSKTSSSSKESSRDASDYKDSKSKDDSKGKSSKHESRSSRDKDRDSRGRHSSKRRHRSRSKDKIESDSQESKDFYPKPKEIKIKEVDKKSDTSDEITDLKDRYKEKIRELREKIELKEKGKLGKVTSDLSKDKKDSLKDKEESKKSSHKSSSSRSSSHHNKSSKSSEAKESRDKSSSRHDERRHSNVSKSSKSRKDSKSDSRSSDRSKDKKRRDEKKSKSTDDHSSLRKNLNDRRSSDRDGSDGSSSKYSQKTSFGANTSSSKFGPTSELTKDSKEQPSSGETDNVHETLKGDDGLPKKVDPGSSEMSLPLKKRRLLSEDSQDENSSKKKRSSEKKALKRKLDQLDSFKSDSDVASVPDEERVQIVEYADEEYEQPYPDKELTLSLEETKKIILDAEAATSSKPTLSEMEQSILSEMMADNNMSKAIIEPLKITDDVKSTPPTEPKLSEMEQSIRDSLSEMMGDHIKSEANIEPKKIISDTESTAPAEQKIAEMEQSLSEMMAIHKTSESDVEPVKVSTVMDSSSLLEALTDDSSRDKEAIAAINREDVVPDAQVAGIEKSEAKNEESSEESVVQSDESMKSLMKVINDDTEVSKEIAENNKEQEADEKNNLSIENQLEQFEAFDDEIEKAIVEKADEKASEIQENVEKEMSAPVVEKSNEIEKEQSSEVSEVHESMDEVAADIEKSSAIEKEHSSEVPEVRGNTEDVVSEIEKSDDIEMKENIEAPKVQENTEKVADIEKFDDIEMKENIEAPEVQENTENVAKIETSDDIEIEESTAVAEAQENTDNVVAEIEKSDVIEKIQTIEEISDTDKVIVEQDTKTADETVQDEENQVSSDEFNEDDTLIIDEDADEKEKEDIEISKVTETPSETEKVEESNEKKNSDESQSNDTEIIEVFDKDNTFTVQDKTEDKFINKPLEQISNEDAQKPNEPETIDNFSVKPSELVEEGKDEIKSELTNELAKFDENDRNDDKHEIQESSSNISVSKDEAPINIINSPAKSDDTIKMDSDDDDDDDIVEMKDDEGKLEEFDPLAEEFLDVEKVNASEDQGSVDIEKPEEVNIDPLASDSFEQESSEEAHCSTDNRMDSTDEEACYYFDNDNEKYLSFKKYLDQLEANLVKDTEKKVGTPAEESPPVVEPMESLATSSASLKRKHSPSPIVENIIKDNNNDGLITTKEPVVTEVSNEEIPVEEPVVVIKKRKVGRMKKSNSSGSVTSSTSQPEQPQDKEQPQAAMVNGENFMMPLSPDSDISVSSDKNLGGNVKEEKSSRTQRSSQRYSSDDLYKPRLLFNSTSRRTTRRYHQA